MGSLGVDGWWNFDRIQVFASNDDFLRASVTMQSYPTNGEFRLKDDNNSTAKILITNSTVNITGKIKQVHSALNHLQYRPGCILDKSNYLEIIVTINKLGRALDSNITNDTSESFEFGVPKRYKVELNMNSGIERKYRGKLVEVNS
jgi:hypothetical protein